MRKRKNLMMLLLPLATVAACAGQAGPLAPATQASNVQNASQGPSVLQPNGLQSSTSSRGYILASGRSGSVARE